MSSDGGGTAWNRFHRCRNLSRNDRLRDLCGDLDLVGLGCGVRDLGDGVRNLGDLTGDDDLCFLVRCVTTDPGREDG